MNPIIEEQIQAIQAQLAVALPGSVQAVALQSQLLVLENEIAEQPIVPPFFPHFFPHGGGGHGGFHGR
jgi:hypothetical protein